MRTESHIVKIVACVDATMRHDCLNQMMAALEHFRAEMAGTPTLRHCTELGVLGFDEIGFTIQPLAPLDQVGPLPSCQPYAGRWINSTAIRYPANAGSLLSNSIIKSALDVARPYERPADYREPTHTVVVLLTQRISPASKSLTGQLSPDQMWLLSLNELFALSAVTKAQKTGGLTLIPFCIDAPAGQRVLAVNTSEGFPAVPVPSNQLDAYFDRLRQLLLRILSYAPGKEPVVEDVFTQFLPDRPLAYPAASPLEFEPVVLGWDAVV